MEVMNIFQDLNIDGKTIILATHDRTIVDKMQKRVIAFKDK
jgi:cell division transport system ATP-binding protein